LAALQAQQVLKKGIGRLGHKKAFPRLAKELGQEAIAFGCGSGNDHSGRIHLCASAAVEASHCLASFPQTQGLRLISESPGMSKG
jgi:hypothetical protein